MTMAYQGAAQSADEQARRKRTRRVVMASVAGNAMEWYDFFIYGTAAALVFGELFFPKGTDPLLGTMGAFAGFAVGFLARPLGGVIFGHIGDRYGRKLALEWTLGIMGAATFLIGLLPTYEQIGIWAPVAMVVLRVMQGAAAGGEWGGGVLLISEEVDGKRRGYFSSFSQLGVAGGFVLSSGVFMLAQQLPQEAFMSWGWRLPFLLSVLIFGIGLYIRKHIPESDEFVQAKKTAKRGMPAVEVFRRYPRQVFTAMGLRVAENGGSYIFLAFALAYGKFLGIPNDVMLGGVLASMFIELGTLVWFGHLSDLSLIHISDRQPGGLAAGAGGLRVRLRRHGAAAAPLDPDRKDRAPRPPHQPRVPRRSVRLAARQPGDDHAGADAARQPDGGPGDRAFHHRAAGPHQLSRGG